ncbi:MAG: DinB family protein [Chitinophagales bacterium]|nr:DinB family protein [Chitinophagales bacterium]MDW8418504.1 DinB family protein [Chitinophagales bacterium]
MYSLLTHLHYNLWANRTICGYIENAGEELFTRETSGSFPTLRHTLLHIWDAEYIWMKRIRGETATNIPGEIFKGNMFDAINGLLQSSAALCDLVEKHPPDFIFQSITYQNLKGDTFQNTVEQILYHVVNHGTYHRGQIIVMLRALGYTRVGSTDLITYLRKL